VGSVSNLAPKDARALWLDVTVDSAAWALFGSVVGTVVGALLTLLGSWTVTRAQDKRAAEVERQRFTRFAVRRGGRPTFDY
jgi:hypothetical protein